MRISTMTVFLVLMSMGAVGCLHQRGPSAHADPRTEQLWRRSFVDNGFTFCDAQVLASFWRVKPEEAKVRAGHKLQTPAGTEALSKLMWEAREQASQKGVACNLGRSGVTDEDIRIIANYWAVSEEEARVACRDKLLWGGYADIRYWVEEAKGKGAYYEGNEDDSIDDAVLFDLYLSNFTYCDAEAVGHFWGTDTYEAKMVLGQKIKYGMPPEEVKTYLVKPAYDAAAAAGVPICQ